MVATYILYNFILFGSTFFIYLYEKAKDKYFAKFCFFIAFLILFIPAAIRYNIGTDYPSYVNIFYSIQSNIDTHVEIGYKMLNKFVAFFGLDAQWLIALVAFLTYFFVFKGYPKKDAWLPHAIFMLVLYMYSYSNLRTCLVLAIMYFATMQYISDKKLYKFIFFMILSTTIHKTALLLIVIPILYSNAFANLMSKKNIVLTCLLFLAVVLVFKNQVTYFILNNPITNILGYSNYADSALFSANTELGSGLGVLLRILPSLVFIYFSLNYIKKNKILTFLVNLQLIYLFCVIMTTSIDIFSRLERLFFVIPLMLNIYFSKIYFSKSKFQIFATITICAFFVIFNANIYKSKTDICEGLRITPYVTIFNKSDYNGLGDITRIDCLAQEKKGN